MCGVLRLQKYLIAFVEKDIEKVCHECTNFNIRELEAIHS
jgi:hypothetical protein